MRPDTPLGEFGARAGTGGESVTKDIRTSQHQIGFRGVRCHGGAAEMVLAEIGIDTRWFPNKNHLTAWFGSGQPSEW